MNTTVWIAEDYRTITLPIREEYVSTWKPWEEETERLASVCLTDDTTRLPTVKHFHFKVKLALFILLFLIILTLWSLVFYASIGFVSAVGIGLVVCSSILASLVKRYKGLSSSKKLPALATQFHMLKEDTLNYLQAVKVSSKERYL